MKDPEWAVDLVKQLTALANPENPNQVGVSQPSAALTAQADAKGALDTSGLDVTDAQMDALLSVDTEVWKEEAALIPPFYERFGDRLPAQLWEEHASLLERLAAAG